MSGTGRCKSFANGLFFMKKVGGLTFFDQMNVAAVLALEKVDFGPLSQGINPRLEFEFVTALRAWPRLDADVFHDVLHFR